MALTEVAEAAEELGTRKGHLRRAMERLVRKKIAVVCMVALAVIYFAGIFAPIIAPYDYSETHFTAIRKPPSWEFWAGTDFGGRDVLSRVLWGIQNTVIITLVSMVTGGLLIGITMGLMSGYFGAWIDSLIMRIGELFAAFPDILFMIIIASALKPRFIEIARQLEESTGVEGIVRSGIVDYFVISLALVAFGWVGMARLVRGQVLALKQTPFVEAARAAGASTPRVLLVHLLPNVISPVAVSVSAGMGAMIGAEIVLSWLGLGIQPPRPSLGQMLLQAGSISALREVPWMLIAPSAVALSLVLAWNLLGDSLNDVLNPHTR